MGLWAVVVWSEAVIITFGGGARLSFVHRGHAAGLFREATQLKTVATVVRGAGIEKLHTEIQIHTEKDVGSG